MTPSEDSEGEEASGVRVVVAALAGNLLIALSKLAAAFFSGSIATLAEAIHSFADCTNQILLMVGMRRARRPPTNLHPFGHAAESYFWPFLVSILLFALGSVFALYEGTHDLIEYLRGGPHDEHGSRLWSYGVLGTSFLFEAASFSVAMREMRKMRGNRTLYQALLHAKDPTIPVVLAEDTAALIGLTIALAAVGLSDLTGWSGFDAIGSMLIGVLLGVVAYFLSARTHSLLLGEAATPEDRAEVTRIVEADADVVSVRQLLSMHLGPKAVVLALKVELRSDLDLAHVEATIDRVEASIREKLPHMRYIFVEPDAHYRQARDSGAPIVTKQTAGR
ncbi:MAG: cation diffusion facilitator family transporter [Sandaracinus sp.]